MRIVCQKKLAVRDEYALYTCICDYLDRRQPPPSDKDAGTSLSLPLHLQSTRREGYPLAAGMSHEMNCL